MKGKEFGVIVRIWSVSSMSERLSEAETLRRALVPLDLMLEWELGIQTYIQGILLAILEPRLRGPWADRGSSSSLRARSEGFNGVSARESSQHAKDCGRHHTVA